MKFERSKGWWLKRQLMTVTQYSALASVYHSRIKPTVADPVLELLEYCCSDKHIPESLWNVV